MESGSTHQLDELSKKNLFFLLRGLLGLLLSYSVSAQDPVQKVIKIHHKMFQLAFQDEFAGNTLDEKKWNYRTDSKHWSTQLPGNIGLKNGLLKIALRKDSANGKAYTGGGIISRDTFGFGYYECALQTPKGSGWHSSFWLMIHDGSGGTSPGATPIEIDILENDSKVKLGYRTDVHNWKNGHKDLGGKYIPSGILNDKLNQVACLYEPDSVTFFFNNKEVDKRNIADLTKSGLHIWLTCIASHLGGSEFVEDAALPEYLIFDYVRYYKPMAEVRAPKKRKT